MLCGVLAGLLVFAAALAQADAKTIPLAPETAKALELFGPGVVGKALPAPPVSALLVYHSNTKIAKVLAKWPKK